MASAARNGVSGMGRGEINPYFQTNLHILTLELCCLFDLEDDRGWRRGLVSEFTSLMGPER